jgi:hypothetical protein
LIEVMTDASGEPSTLTRTDVRGRNRAPLRVELVEEVWRVAEAWWRAPVQARTYYRVRLEGGRLLTLFHDDVTGAWHEQPYSAPERHDR